MQISLGHNSAGVRVSDEDNELNDTTGTQIGQGCIGDRP